MAPGKTAPRLLQDLLTYDPRREERAGRNLLTSAPPEHNESRNGIPAVPRGNCRHALVRKDEQCQLPVPGDDPDASTVYKVASYCTQCRWHIDVIVDFKGQGFLQGICGRQNHDSPLHHFVYEADDGTNSNGLDGPQVSKTFTFRCSAAQCPTAVRIDLKKPRFTDHDQELMMNKAQLRRRFEKSKELVGEREGETMARTVDAPDHLDTFLKDSLNPVQGKTRVPLLNRKFVKAFGRDCDSILKRLGFEHVVEVSEDENEPKVEAWYLPKPGEQQHPLQSTLRTTIEDARYELDTIILAVPEHERPKIRHEPLYTVPAQGDIEKVLACHDYERVIGRTRGTSFEEDHPYYASLGAVGDFSDSLIYFAFRRQSTVDKVNAPYYLECLQDLAIGRNSDALQMEVATLASQGIPNRRELDAAYRYIGMEPAHGNSLSDEFIINQVRSRLPDVNPADRVEMRRRLRIIGDARGSEAMRREASETIDTYEEALSWLDLDPAQPDDFVRTMFTIKTQDNPACTESARKAVSVIAEHRNSDRLRQFLHEGTMTEPEMDLSEAYALFEISAMSDRQNVDLSVLQSSMLVAPPSDIGKLQKAYMLIEEDQAKNYNNEEEKQKEPGSRVNDFPLETWPVGCRNNGNTCYLNSVLQFLFTIKPLRDLVLNFDAYVQDPSPEALKGKKVGRTVVTPKRVATAQNFVRELQSLFQWMIHAPTDNVLPTQYLAILALCKTDSPETEAKTPETEAEVKENIEPINKPVPDPTKTDSPATISADSEMDAEDTKNDDAQSESSTQAVDGNIDASGHPSPPTRPPPIPPRPQAQPQTKAPEKTTEDHIRESARQQDAAEVMGNILDLISCAIKGDGVLQDGEQDDLIKNLFFSNVTIVRNTKDKAEKTSEPRNHHLISAGGRDRHLYAALDDDFGLSELEGGDSKYEYIGTAAPIQIINVRRLQFNKEKKQQVRDTAQLSLDDVLYLDRYLEETQTLSGDKLLQLRKAQWAKQQELQRLAVRCKELQASEVEGMDLSNAVEETAMFTESFFAGIEQRMFDPLPTPPPEELPGSLHERARQLQAELEDISASMTTLESDIDTVFKQYHDHGYRLHAIFVHRGGTGSGHYLIYIKDFQNDMWREYNDETVKAYTTEDIFKLGSGALAAGSTGIVFVKESAINTLTEAVCRQPDTAAVAGTAATLDHRDTEMMDLDAPKMELGNLEVIEGVEKS